MKLKKGLRVTITATGTVATICDNPSRDGFIRVRFTNGRTLRLHATQVRVTS